MDAVPFRLFASVVIRDRGKILLVREGKPVDEGRFNLPGGHVKAGEKIADAAAREVLEETGLGVYLTELVGVYTAPIRAMIGKARAPDPRPRGIRFVFTGHAVRGEPTAGDDILEVRWMSIEKAVALPEDAVQSPTTFFRILADVREGMAFPVSVLKEI